MSSMIANMKISQEERSHEKERDFDIIQINSDDSDNEARILESLLINREEKIHDLRADLRGLEISFIFWKHKTNR